MSTHNIGFYEEMAKIIFQLSSIIIKYTLPLFFWLTVIKPSCQLMCQFGVTNKRYMYFDEYFIISDAASKPLSDDEDETPGPSSDPGPPQQPPLPAMPPSGPGPGPGFMPPMPAGPMGHGPMGPMGPMPMGPMGPMGKVMKIILTLS